MAGPSDSTPLLADNGHMDSHDETENHLTETTPVNTYFKRSIKLSIIIISFLSLSIFGLLIATHVLLVTTGPFQYTRDSKDAIRALAICLLVNFILSALTILLQIPIIINIPVHIAILIVIFVYSEEMLGKGWPEANYGRFCWPDEWECTHARDVIKITMGVSAGFGIVIGLLLITVVLLELTALVRTIVWEGKRVRNFNGENLSGFAAKFTVNILPGSEEARLIET